MHGDMEGEKRENTTGGGGAILDGGSAPLWMAAALEGAGHVVDIVDLLDFVYFAVFVFTVPAAVKDPKHNCGTPFINDLVNNIPKEWFGNGFCDFACGLDVLICTVLCP